MAYNRGNLLKRIIEIQNLVLELQNQDDCLSLKDIHKDYIKPDYNICYKTFHNYLDTNAKRDLKAIQKTKGLVVVNDVNDEITKDGLTTINKLVKSLGDVTLSIKTIEYKDGTKSRLLSICSNYPCKMNEKIHKTKTDNYRVKNQVVVKTYDKLK